ncbi:MAG: protein kinase [Smithella sp.]
MNIKGYILLINREKKFLETVQRSLLDAGYSVLTATTMSSAVNLLSNNKVALVICDSELNDFSGYDLLRFIKNNPQLEMIPFMFFVPVHDQGNAGKAFRWGATDFIVYPLDGKILIERIGEILSPQNGEGRISISPKEDKHEQISQPVNVASPIRKECRKNNRIIPKDTINIEVSRDAILWLPGQIKNISKQGFLMETPLLGRPGMLLYVRIQLPNGKCVIESQVRHVSISNHQLLADIGVEIGDSAAWTEVYDHIIELVDTGKNPAADRLSVSGEIPDLKKISAAKARPEAETIVVLTENETIYTPPSQSNFNEPPNGKALEIRFYHSLVGTQLGNYKAVSFIGAGAMGGVFKGWVIIVERNVALKIISYKLSSIDSFREMFVKEARLISQLTHPNIAQIYYIDQSDDVFYFAMELISGGTLKDMIRDSNNLNSTRGLEYLITICRTLDFVSGKNIIHRDIKPENIMISDNGTLKVVDFGVAVVNDGKNKKGKSENLVGSPYYVSPDCIKGLPLDARSDIYSLGATFYHFFAGVPPFEGDSVEDILLKHLNEDIVPLKTKNPTVSNWLSDIIGKMMAKNPGDRYQRYKDIIADLDLLMH